MIEIKDRKYTTGNDFSTGNAIQTQARGRFAASVLLIALLLFPWLQSEAAQPSALASVNKMIAAMKKHPSLDIVFTVWQDGSSSSGTLSTQGKMFHLSMPEIKVWFDGRNQWAYSAQTGEANLSEPTAAELAETNPLSILSGLGSNFTFLRLKAPAGQERIQLTPKKKTDGLSSAVLVIDSSTSLPRELTVKDSHGRSVTVKLSSVKGGKTKPRGAFTFNPARYPGVEVIDLR